MKTVNPIDWTIEQDPVTLCWELLTWQKGDYITPAKRIQLSADTQQRAISEARCKLGLTVEV
jgi:hypothetical protein